jgi:hypothetical protein
MPQTQLAPQQPATAPARAQGYVVRVSKTQWNHPVRYVVKDTRDVVIAAGTVPQGRPHDEFLVKQNVGFTAVNVGQWDLIIAWP